tara:strand:+ start:26594 stop:27013 length:420 start_codon:yes stop_codon:yes gene_type:complete
MNWGKGIALTLIAFIAFIVTLGVKMMRADADLVSEDYYIKEVKYGNEITAQENARSAQVKLTKDVSNDGVMFSIDQATIASGKLKLIRSNDPGMDVNVDLKGKNVFIDQEKLSSGKYDVVIDWNDKNKSYQVRDVLWIP